MDLTISNTGLYCILFTDFGATLDLMVAEKDNLSVNNHAVICIFFVSSNWMNARLKKQAESSEDAFNEIIVNDCHRWLFFGDAQSKGKNNYHVSHDACTTHIIIFYNAGRMQNGK